MLKSLGETFDMTQTGSGMRITAVLALLLCFHNAAAGRNKIVLKVNLGDGPLADFLGESDVYDMENEGYPKQSSNIVVQGTTQPQLFQKQRFSRGEDLMLRAPVPDGIYSVTLLMAELYEPACRPGVRVFDIALGTPHSGLTTVAPDFDLFSEAGCGTAYGKRFENVVSKDGIVIRLGQKKQHPTVAGYMVEGYPVPKDDGSEYKAIAQMAPEELEGGIGSAGNGLASSEGNGIGGMGGSAMSGEDAEVGGIGGSPGWVSRTDNRGAGVVGGMGDGSTGEDVDGTNDGEFEQAGGMGVGDTNPGVGASTAAFARKVDKAASHGANGDNYFAGQEGMAPPTQMTHGFTGATKQGASQGASQGSSLRRRLLANGRGDRRPRSGTGRRGLRGTTLASHSRLRMREPSQRRL